MKRHLMTELECWKRAFPRKPLIIHGARQVGKTWLLKEFGRIAFRNTVYVSFDNNPALASLFRDGYNLQAILLGLQAETGELIQEGETLVIFDEIQECPQALTSLKYFHENMPDLHIAAAGSLLGLTLHSGTGFPVGNVTTFELFPLTFSEFLGATGNGILSDLLLSPDPAPISAFAPKVIPLLRQYYYVGGMPAAVAAFIRENRFQAARTEQLQILSDYRFDISKHVSAVETERILAVWDSIPRHLGKENKKFIFGQIREGARARDYRRAITWLSQAGLVSVVNRVAKPGMPLAAYAESDAFKLFLVDIGLLGAMAGLQERAIIEGSRAFTEFKGALAEQYVCQQLRSSCGLRPFYWTSENTGSEIDFIVQSDDGIFPIEVKAEENLRAKSLKAFADKYDETHPLRFSLSGFRIQSWMRNIPLYAMQNTTLWNALE